MSKSEPTLTLTVEALAHILEESHEGLLDCIEQEIADRQEALEALLKVRDILTGKEA